MKAEQCMEEAERFEKKLTNLIKLVFKSSSFKINDSEEPANL